MKDYNYYDSDFDVCELEEKQHTDYQRMLKEAEIYSMNFKEFQIYIYYQLEDIKSSLSTILDVVKRKWVNYELYSNGGNNRELRRKSTT